MKIHLADTPLDYDGTQLTSHWIYRQFKLQGNALVAFVGKANVSLDHMVDLEDVQANAPIYSPKMVHFIGEWFIPDLDKAIHWQHLLIHQIYEQLLQHHAHPKELHRRGNDLYYQKRKLSVSIATASPVSVLIHAGINIHTDGTPIPTSGLFELGIDPFQFAKKILDQFQTDYEGWQKARTKVQPVA